MHMNKIQYILTTDSVNNGASCYIKCPHNENLQCVDPFCPVIKCSPRLTLQQSSEPQSFTYKRYLNIIHPNVRRADHVNPQFNTLATSLFT